MSLALLTIVFHVSMRNSPEVAMVQNYGNQTGLVCPAFSNQDNALPWHCTTCIAMECGFCEVEGSVQVKSFCSNVFYMVGKMGDKVMFIFLCL